MNFKNFFCNSVHSGFYVLFAPTFSLEVSYLDFLSFSYGIILDYDEVPGLLELLSRLFIFSNGFKSMYEGALPSSLLFRNSLQVVILIHKFLKIK